MTDPELRAIAEKATPGPWWQTAMPWNDTGTSVHAGDYDPHRGKTVTDTDTSFTDAEEESRDVANAVHIAVWHPARALAALDVIEAARAVIKEGQTGIHYYDGQYANALEAALARWDK